MSNANGLRRLQNAPEALIDLVKSFHEFETTKMRRCRKETFDIFDFPGTSPCDFDLLQDRYGAIVGNHRHGFNVSTVGLKFIAKSQVPA